MLTQFYMTPGTCSTGVHILLEECDLLYQINLVNLMAGDQHRAEYLAINPKATIPALVREDGSALTDFQSIAWWLAETYPQAKLLPESLDDRLKIIDAMNYAIATVHAQGFARIFTTDTFTPNEADYEQVKQQGNEIIERGFKVLDAMITESGYLTETFSIADAALFYVEFWADKTSVPMSANLSRHYNQMLQRPSVRQVLMEEGYPVAA